MKTLFYRQPAFPGAIVALGLACSLPLAVPAQVASNPPPTVAIVAPTNGAIFTAPADISIVADARDANGYVARVEFFDGTLSLGARTNNPASASPVNPFLLTWSNAPAGYHLLTAVATDNQGIASVSEPVTLLVRQLVPPVPTVTIVATLPQAAERCGMGPTVLGKFTLYRDAGLNTSLKVWLSIGGTASNGLDYAMISNAVIFPLGAPSVDILVVPLPDPAAGAALETVVVGIMPIACPALWPPVPGCYAVGQPAQATVSIAQCPGTTTNRPPSARITSPPNCYVFRAPVDIPIYSYAFDPDGSVSTVECFAGTNSLGFARRLALPVYGGGLPPISQASSNTFVLVWSNAPAGAFALTSKATDNAGNSAVSAPVNITVLPALPPPTNLAAVVSIAATDPVAIEGTNCWPWPAASAVGGATQTSSTNCGPKPAVFTVTRAGATNRALLVSYSLGGTASNGVDYVSLPGVVTIPAGYRRVPILVVPIDDGPPDLTSTVVINLTTNAAAPTNSYKVGYPATAAAVILDKYGPTPFAANILADKSFRLSIPGPCGGWFRIEYSTDMLNWQALSTVQSVNETIDFVDSDAPQNQARFYRAVPDADPGL